MRVRIIDETVDGWARILEGQSYGSVDRFPNLLDYFPDYCRQRKEV